MVAQDQDRHTPDIALVGTLEGFMRLIGERMAEFFSPEPLYLDLFINDFLVFVLEEFWDVVGNMARVYAPLNGVWAAIFEFPQIDDHGPSLGPLGLGMRPQNGFGALSQAVSSRHGPETQRGQACDLQEYPSALVHY
jgi:hypothetical protein